MSASLNIHQILSSVKKLEKEDQLTILERLVAIIRQEDDVKKSKKLSAISGIGAKIWKKTNIDDYIDQERQW